MPTAEAVAARECAVLARYLGWRGDTAELADVYARMSPVVSNVQISSFEQVFTRAGCRNVIGATLCDAYARIRFPHGLLRRKLVAVLAVLESMRDSHTQFDGATPSSAVMAWSSLAVLAARWVVITSVSVAVLAPWDGFWHLFRRNVGRG